MTLTLYTKVKVDWPKRNAIRHAQRHQAWLRRVHDMPNDQWQAGQKWFKAYKGAAMRAAKVARCPKSGEEWTLLFTPAEENNRG